MQLPCQVPERVLQALEWHSCGPLALLQIAVEVWCFGDKAVGCLGKATLILLDLLYVQEKYCRSVLGIPIVLLVPRDTGHLCA